mgnify:CR=1 FL=1
MEKLSDNSTVNEEASASQHTIGNPGSEGSTLTTEGDTPTLEAYGKSLDTPSTDHISDTDEEGEEEVPKGTRMNPIQQVPNRPIFNRHESLHHTREERVGMDWYKRMLYLKNKESDSGVISIPFDKYIPTDNMTRSSLPISRDIEDVNFKKNMTQSNEPVLSEEKCFRLLQTY